MREIFHNSDKSQARINIIFQIRNYFVASGMRSIGVGAAGGVAEVIASYISKGLPSFDVYNLDIQVIYP